MTTARGPVTLTELTAGLIWPTIFRAVPVALHPSRLAVGFVMVALIMGVGSLHDALTAPVVDGGERGVFGEFVALVVDVVNNLARGVVLLEPGLIAFALFDRPAAAWALLADRPWSSLLLMLATIAIWSLGGGALSRMALSDVAAQVNLTAGQGFGFALRRWKHCFLALLGPVTLIFALAAAMMIAGFLLLRWPGVNVVGGLLYGLFLIAGLAVVLLTVCFGLGKALLIPAVAAESTDWVDAIQRAYAYVLGRTGRLLIYGAVILVYGAIAYAIAALLTALTLNLTSALAFAWADVEAPAERIAGGYRALGLMVPEREPAPEGSLGVAAAIIGVWERIAIALLAAFAISLYFAGSSILYLLVRRVNDEQDIHEIWMPEMIESTMAPVEPARSASPEAARPDGV